MEKALTGRGSPRNTLTGCCNGLLTLLTSSQAVALNRAAMNSPKLANQLLVSGRLRVGPIVELYLQRLQTEGSLRAHDSVDAFAVLYGLVVRDSQIRALLGESALSPAEISSRAKEAVADFFRLYGPPKDQQWSGAELVSQLTRRTAQRRVRQSGSTATS